MYLLNLIYKQPLTTSVMRGAGWMTAIINLATIFTFIDQKRGVISSKNLYSECVALKKMLLP